MTTQITHTPGPLRAVTEWPAKTNVLHGDIMYAAPIVCAGSSAPTAVGNAYGDTQEEADANAVLWAAAPDMLAALEACALAFGETTDPAVRSWWEAMYDIRGPGGAGLTSSEIRREVIESARAALAKARGD